MNKNSELIRQRIELLKDEEKGKWLENYVKHNIKSIGVGIPEIRVAILALEKEVKYFSLDFQKQSDLLNDLMKQEITEFKLAAIVFAQLNADKYNPKKLLQLISDWFDNGWITDWNVCDWLCVRLLTPLVNNHARLTVAELQKWNSNSNLWKARASLVPFAQCKTISVHRKIINTFSIVLIKREERFAKTAVGWVMRQFSKVDKNYVLQFLEQYKHHTTAELVKNARKYID